MREKYSLRSVKVSASPLERFTQFLQSRGKRLTRQRRLIVEQELDRHALKIVLGLDPIAEQEAAQIPLF